MKPYGRTKGLQIFLIGFSETDQTSTVFSEVPLVSGPVPALRKAPLARNYLHALVLGAIAWKLGYTCVSLAYSSVCLLGRGCCLAKDS